MTPSSTLSQFRTRRHDHGDPGLAVPRTLPALRREWNRAKGEVAPWRAENGKEASSSGLDGLARALRNYSDSKSGRRKGRPIGFPHRKRKGRCRDACRFTTGAIKVLSESSSSTWAGMVRNRRLARVLADAGRAELRRQLTYKTSWYGSQLVVADASIPLPRCARPVVG